MNLQLLVFLWAGHYLADFALQTGFMSDTKRLVFVKDIGVHSLTAHAFIHGLVGGVVAQNLAAGVVIGVTHGLIDFARSSVLFGDFLKSKGFMRGKKEALFGIHVDQLLHFLVILAVAWRLS